MISLHRNTKASVDTNIFTRVVRVQVHTIRGYNYFPQEGSSYPEEQCWGTPAHTINMQLSHLFFSSPKYWHWRNRSGGTREFYCFCGKVQFELFATFSGCQNPQIYDPTPTEGSWGKAGGTKTRLFEHQEYAWGNSGREDTHHWRQRLAKLYTEPQTAPRFLLPMCQT